jgi:hypothetical protein
MSCIKLKYQRLIIISLILICSQFDRPLNLDQTGGGTEWNQFFENEVIPDDHKTLNFGITCPSSPSPCVKVEIVNVQDAVLLDSFHKDNSNLNFQIKLYSKRRLSLISHHKYTISDRLNFSLLTNIILQI